VSSSEIIPDDEYIDDEPCTDGQPHKDHYWRKDGKRFRYLDDPTVRYCHGAAAKDGREGGGVSSALVASQEWVITSA
jgi:hypothetical protein